MGRELVGSADVYLNALRGSSVQTALRNGQIPTRFLAFCIESGVMDCHDETLLFEIEKSAGGRIKPRVQPSLNLGNPNQSSKVSSTAGMPFVNADGGKPPFARLTSADEIYKETVREGNEKLNGDVISKDFKGCICYNARKDWCTPELMRCLLMDPGFVHKLRAAMYPAVVSYSERIFKESGKTYMVPYITIIENISKLGNKTLNKEETIGAFTTTFYLNKNGRIGTMMGDIKHVYEKENFSSPDAIKRYLKELEDAFYEHFKGCPRANRKQHEKSDLDPLREFLTPYITEKKPIGDPEKLMNDFIKVHKRAIGGDTDDLFLNIKTGQSVRTVIRNNRKEIRQDGNDWFKVFDATNCVDPSDGLVMKNLIGKEMERQGFGPPDSLRERALYDLCRLNKKLYGTEGWEATRGRDEWYKYDWSR